MPPPHFAVDEELGEPAAGPRAYMRVRVVYACCCARGGRRVGNRCDAAAAPVCRRATLLVVVLVCAYSPTRQDLNDLALSFFFRREVARVRERESERKRERESARERERERESVKAPRECDEGMKHLKVIKRLSADSFSEQRLLQSRLADSDASWDPLPPLFFFPLPNFPLTPVPFVSVTLGGGHEPEISYSLVNVDPRGSQLSLALTVLEQG